MEKSNLKVPPETREAAEMMLNSEKDRKLLVTSMYIWVNKERCGRMIFPCMREMNRRKAVEWLDEALEQIAHLVCGTTPDETGRCMIANILIDRYGDMTAEDMIMALKMGCMNEWGNFYGRVDLPTLCGWMEEYRPGMYRCRVHR